MREGTFVPEGDIKKSLDEWARQVHDDTQEFLERCEVVYQFFPELNEIKNKYLPQAIYDLRIKVATNQDFIREVYSTFLDEHAPSDAPQPETLEPNWAFFRWTQCQLMSALRMFGKHQGNIKLPAPTGVFIRAEHTMHDIYYTILATLSGALASFDREIIEDFSLCCPEGALIVKQ